MSRSENPKIGDLSVRFDCSERVQLSSGKYRNEEVWVLEAWVTDPARSCNEPDWMTVSSGAKWKVEQEGNHISLANPRPTTIDEAWDLLP